jgi:uncharacterized membrane protein YraQ (UPF0718 family)
MSPKRGAPVKVSGIYFLALVLLAYLLLFGTTPDKALAALAESWQVLAKLLPALIVVIVLLGLFNYFFNPKKMARFLGSESGLRGWLIAVAGGILSHGPAYIWFPLLSDLRGHGTKMGLIAAFIYVRAIKLPWIPLMVEYFGWPFTIIISLYLIVGGVVQGLLIDLFDRWVFVDRERPR